MFTQRCGRWLENADLPSWYPRKKKAMTPQKRQNGRTKHKFSTGPKVRSGKVGRDLLSHEPRPSVKVPYEQGSYQNSNHTRAGSFSSITEDAWISTRETSTVADLGEYTEQDQLGFPLFDNSASEVQRAPAYNVDLPENEDYGIFNVLDDDAFEHGDDTGMLDSFTGLHSLGGAEDYSTTPYFPSTSQTYPTTIMTNNSLLLDQPATSTQNNIFLSRNLQNVRPRTQAEINSIQSALENVRREYRMELDRDPPQTTATASYTEQYNEIQAHLEQVWPYPFAPVKLSSRPRLYD